MSSNISNPGSGKMNPDEKLYYGPHPESQEATEGPSPTEADQVIDSISDAVNESSIDLSDPEFHKANLAKPYDPDAKFKAGDNLEHDDVDDIS